jgi:hypothetical protein
MIVQAGQPVQANSAYNGCPDSVLGNDGASPLASPPVHFSVSRSPFQSLNAKRTSGLG